MTCHGQKDSHLFLNKPVIKETSSWLGLVWVATSSFKVCNAFCEQKNIHTFRQMEAGYLDFHSHPTDVADLRTNFKLKWNIYACFNVYNLKISNALYCSSALEFWKELLEINSQCIQRLQQQSVRKERPWYTLLIQMCPKTDEFRGDLKVPVPFKFHNLIQTSVIQKVHFLLQKSSKYATFAERQLQYIDVYNR